MTLRRAGQFLVVLIAVLSLTGLSWFLPHSDPASLLSPNVAFAGDPDAMEEVSGPITDDPPPPPQEEQREEEKSAESGSLWGAVLAFIESLL